jgi:hypothetical protein
MHITKLLVNWGTISCVVLVWDQNGQTAWDRSEQAREIKVLLGITNTREALSRAVVKLSSTFGSPFLHFLLKIYKGLHNTSGGAPPPARSTTASGSTPIYYCAYLALLHACAVNLWFMLLPFYIYALQLASYIFGCFDNRYRSVE